jgi:hypothetical protein
MFDETTKSKLMISLVHGTWGRSFPSVGGRWFEEGSIFREILQARLKLEDLSFEIREFHWSGRNSIRARERGAAELAQRLATSAEACDGYRSIIIAHSHGGNLALEAIRRSGIKSRLALVSLATPYLDVRELPRSASVFRQIDTLIAAIFFILFQSVLFAIVLPELPDDLRRIHGMDDSYETSISIAMCVIALVLVRCVVVGFHYGESAWKSPAFRVDPSIPILALRATDDEANLALIGGAIGAKLLSILFLLSYPVLLIGFAITVIPFVMQFVSQFGIFVIGTVLAIAFSRSIPWKIRVVAVASFVGLALLPSAVRDAWALSIGGLILYAAVSLQLATGTMILLLFSIALSRSINGRELLLGGVGYEVNVQSAPDSENVKLVSLGSADGERTRLRHSIYDHEECAPVIAAWISLTVTRRELLNRGPDEKLGDTA